MKGLKERTKEFLEQGSVDTKPLLEFSEKVLEQQEVLHFTIHLTADQKIDCSCLGTLCLIEGVPTEEMLGCKRIRVMYLEDAEKEEGFEPRPDHFQV